MFTSFTCFAFPQQTTRHLNLILASVVDGYTYIISNGQLYRRDHKMKEVDPEFRKEIRALWKGAPANPTAAVYSRAAESLFLFEGQ